MDNNQEPQVQEPAAEKMFTQAELDEIIEKDQLKREQSLKNNLKAKLVKRKDLQN